jgi:hypothetical protein
MRTWLTRDGATDTGRVIYYFSDHLKIASEWLLIKVSLLLICSCQSARIRQHLRVYAIQTIFENK